MKPGEIRVLGLSRNLVKRKVHLHAERQRLISRLQKRMDSHCLNFVTQAWEEETRIAEGDAGDDDGDG